MCDAPLPRVVPQGNTATKGQRSSPATSVETSPHRDEPVPDTMDVEGKLADHRVEAKEPVVAVVDVPAPRSSSSVQLNNTQPAAAAPKTEVRFCVRTTDAVRCGVGKQWLHVKLLSCTSLHSRSCALNVRKPCDAQPRRSAGHGREQRAGCRRH